MKKITAAVSAFVLLFSCMNFNITVSTAAKASAVPVLVETKTYNFENVDLDPTTNRLDFTNGDNSIDKNTAVKAKIKVSGMVDGTYAGIVEDEGDKALKVSSTGKSNLSAVLFFEEAYTEKIEVSFNVKIDSNNGGLNSFCGFGMANADGSETTYSSSINNYAKSNFWYVQNSNDAWVNMNNLNAAYFPVTIKIDLTTKTFGGEMDRTNARKEGQYVTNPVKTFSDRQIDAGVDNVNKMSVVVFGNSNYTNATSGVGTYYIDDIVVKKYAYPQMKAESFSAPSENADPDAPVIVTMSEEVDPSLVEDYVELYKGEDKLNNAVVGVGGTNKEISVSLPDGWDYDTEYSVKVKSDIEANLLKIKPMDADYTKTFKTRSVVGGVNITKPNQRFNASFTLSHTPVAGYTYTKELKPEGGEFSSYDGSTLTELKKYTLKITAEKTGDTSGRCEIKEYSFEVIGEEAPKAENVTISGTMKRGETLEITYDYVDENDDSDDLKEDLLNSIFSWLASSEENGTYTEIANTKTVTVDERFEDKYIKVEVNPASLLAPTQGQTMYKIAAAVKGIFRPVVTKSEISRTGDTLTAVYEASDKNEGDTIIGATYQWYSSADKDSGYAPITGATNATYTIRDTDYDKYILVEIKALSDNEPAESLGLKSAYVTAPFRPVVSDLKITGTVRAGQTVGAEYTFYDENGDTEKGSIISWYIDAAKVGEGTSFSIPFNKAGRKLYYTVQPKTENALDGILTTSAVVNIASEIASTGGGGGGGSSYIPFVPSTPQTPEEPDTQDEPTQSGGAFEDMESHWAKDAVERLYGEGIITGVTADEFRPDNTVTRAEVAAILARALELESADADFIDVLKDSWYYDAVAKVQSAGIFMGNAGLFRPDDKITRQEMACVIARVIEKYSVVFDATENIFDDALSIADWAKDSVSKVSAAGIINGMGDGTFAPGKNATRAEAVMMMVRLLDLMEGNNNE